MVPSQGGPSAAVRPPRLSVVVADQIQADLVAERRVAGDGLPTEQQLAARYGVSRTVVREAARLLEQRGLVDIRPGRGMIVAALDGSVVADQYLLMLRMSPVAFDQLMEMRLLVEVGGAGMAARRRDDDDVAQLRACLARARQHVDDYEVCLAADLEFHALVARASRNPFLSLFVDPVNTCLREAYREPVAYLAHQQDTLDEHQEMCEAIAAGDAERAERASRTHLERVLRQGAELVPDR